MSVRFQIAILVFMRMVQVVLFGIGTIIMLATRSRTRPNGYRGGICPDASCLASAWPRRSNSAGERKSQHAASTCFQANLAGTRRCATALYGRGRNRGSNDNRSSINRYCGCRRCHACDAARVCHVQNRDPHHQEQARPERQQHGSSDCDANPQI
jgi:hypothetical protein